jgi:hypothetical protein
VLVTAWFRALFDYDPTKDHVPSSIRALYFAFGDILHVVLPPTSVAEAAHSTTGVDWWQARRVVPWSDPENSAGFIPSKTRCVYNETGY